MTSQCRILALFFSSLFLFFEELVALSEDGVLLLQFKYSVVDPLEALGDWNYDDPTPCAWSGVICMGFLDAGASGSATADAAAAATSRVVGLVLPNSELAGSLPPELGLIRHLRHLELSGNALNGSLPQSIFNSSELRVLSLANNDFSGELPPGGFGGRAEYVNLSANFINGSLPPNLGGQSLLYLNLSRNHISGTIPPELASGIPANSTVDLAFNDLSGEIPQTGVFATQKPEAFAGNFQLCGKPLENLCTIPSTLSSPPNSTTGTPLDRPPAFAAMPENAADRTPTAGGGQRGLRPAVIIAIAVGGMAGIGFLCAMFYYIYYMKMKNREEQHRQLQQGNAVALGMNKQHSPPPPQPSSELRGFSWLFCCLKGKDDEEEEDSEESSTSSDPEAEEETRNGAEKVSSGRTPQQPGATLVTVDGETELELETLLKASAYILAASGSSIVYKAVLADGTALAVRRIGQSSTIDKLKDFEARVRSIAQLRHPNLLRLRGFYWSADEKLLIHEYAPNGSLANISFSTKRQSSSPFHLSWESRLRIARGLARGLAYLHEKKSVHGNLNPSNILLDADMEPKIADLGLERLLSGEGGGGGYRLGTSSRLFGSKRSLQWQGILPELSPPAPAVASPCASSSAASAVYQAPEFLKNLKPSVKWDVYSFGAVLLEVLAGRVVSEEEVDEWNAGGLVTEERHRVVRMADPAVRGEAEGKEDAMTSCFRLGFACCAAAPQRRPAMKEAVQVLEKLPPPPPSSLS
ncbi:probable LRR receptor-like serine/threonine-protein kinase At4g37250 [Zingiber officinale]|uniref:probable LRR receptor-like serine/threonine-protein kinase At4g37250 n=1 Tax=Zingiber officinale TaxID=94328 RepID=UPI001C4CE084|nr:probable LRR receptor-like serine/threonine-protein kinase At4g37250 [Zingiber officinale]